MNENKNILEVKNLSVSFNTYAGEVQALRDVSFSVKRGETLAIVGESGSGKSVTVQTIMRLIPMPPGIIKSGEIFFEGEDLVKVSEKRMMQLRGKKIGMIFQDPMTSLNPTMKIGKQIMEVLLIHKKISKEKARKISLEMLRKVGITNPKERFKQYPHQLSGGMRQRIVIAIALVCEPDLLICDEPTTALDVTIQAQILELIKDLQRDYGAGAILITHDLGVVSEMADNVAVMYAGQIVEYASITQLFDNPQHPYTRSLLKSMPSGEEEELHVIQGVVPSLHNINRVGCRFGERTPWIDASEHEVNPTYHEVEPGHLVLCTCYKNFRFSDEGEQ